MNDLSIYKIRCGTRQEDGGTHQVFGRAPACGRCAADDIIVQWITGRAISRIDRRSNITRANAIDLDIMRRPFGSQVAGEHFQSTFGSCIGCYGIATELTHERADIYDLALLTADHVSTHILAQ